MTLQLDFGLGLSQREDAIDFLNYRFSIAEILKIFFQHYHDIFSFVKKGVFLM